MPDISPAKKKSGMPNQARRRRRLSAYKKARKVRNRLVKRLILQGRVDVLATELGYRFDDVHKAIVAHQQKNKTSLQLAARGWGKTTINLLALAVIIIQNRDIRILLASETITQASNFLSELKGILTHPRTVELFGDLKGKIWHENGITVAGRNTTRKELTVMCTGVDGAITSAHFDIICADDLVTLKNSRTEYSRDKTRQWFYTTLLPCITDEYTQFRVLGTRYHPDDLYGHLLEYDPKFKGFTQLIPADNPETGESNNPDIYSTDFLTEMRESMGHIFYNAQFNQNPTGVQGSVFDDRFFRHVDQLPRDLVVFQGVDLAIGEKKRHAKFAIVTIGIHRRTLNIYLIDYYTAKISVKEQDEVIYQHWLKHEPVAVGIEANAYQASKVETLKEDEEYGVVQAVPIWTDKDKMTRAQRLDVRYRRGEIWHLKVDKDGEFEEQVLAFPDGKYKDLLDALDIAIRVALKRRKRRKRRKKEPGLLGVGGTLRRRRGRRVA